MIYSSRIVALPHLLDGFVKGQECSQLTCRLFCCVHIDFLQKSRSLRTSITRILLPPPSMNLTGGKKVYIICIAKATSQWAGSWGLLAPAGGRGVLSWEQFDTISDYPHDAIKWGMVYMRQCASFALKIDVCVLLKALNDSRLTMI